MPKFTPGAVVNHKTNGYSWTVEHTDPDGLVLCTAIVKDGSVVQLKFHEDNLTIEDPSAIDVDLGTGNNTSLP